MWLRIGGGCCLLVAAFAISAGLGREKRRKLALLQEWVTLLRYLQRQISSFSLPIGEALREYSPRSSAFAPVLAAACRDGLSAAVTVGTAGLPPRAVEALRRYAAEAGCFYRAEEVTLCGECRAVLEEEYAVWEKKIPSEIKTDGIIIRTAGVALVLLLL